MYAINNSIYLYQCKKIETVTKKIYFKIYYNLITASRIICVQATLI